MAETVCTCSLRSPHKGRGADPAHCPVHGESRFGPLDEHGHDGHAPQLNGLLADCPGCTDG